MRGFRDLGPSLRRSSGGETVDTTGDWDVAATFYSGVLGERLAAAGAELSNP